MIGQKLNNRYKITSLLGEGGMGEVFLATDQQTGQKVAVKALSRPLSANPDALERFRREAETLRQLDHPNIVKFVDAFEHKGQYIIVMEYVPGGSLFDLLKQGSLPIDRSRQIALDLCDALIRAHRLNVIHRDIKPDNVLIAEDGTPKLADFGVARLSEGTRMTRTGTQVGTPYYMAPEAWEGKPLDEQADIWSLGVMLYEMLSGKVPFDGDSGAAVMKKILTTPPPDLKKLRADVPPDLTKITTRMLTRDKNRRYSSMRQVSVDLEGKAQSGTFIPRLDKRILYGAGLLAVVAVVTVIVFAFIFLNNTSFLNSTETATTPSLEVEQQIIVPDWTPTVFRTSTPAPVGGQWIAFNSRLGGSADIYMVDIDGNNLTQLTTGSSHEFYPSWSPDGTRLIYQTNEGGDQELAIVNISNKNIEFITDNNCNDWAPVWSPAGDWIVFYSDCDGERNVYKIREDGSSRTQLTTTSGSYSWFPSWSPDGGRITFSSNRSGRFYIYVMDADGDNVTELAQGCISYYSPDGEQILYGVYCDDTDDLFIMDADGSNQRPLTDGFECKNATWSPDGLSVVFQLSQTTKDGPFQLYRMWLDQPDRSDWVLLTDYDVNGGSPVWQP